MGGVIFLLCLYFVVPVFLGKIVVRGTWHSILLAYAIWFGLLALWGLGSAGRVEEGLGWAMIAGMFLTIPALPVIVVALKLTGVR